MGIPVVIYGKSGSGKTTSLRNFGKDEILYVNVEKKALPFRGDFTYHMASEKASVIIDQLDRLGHDLPCKTVHTTVKILYYILNALHKLNLVPFLEEKNCIILCVIMAYLQTNLRTL